MTPTQPQNQNQNNFLTYFAIAAILIGGGYLLFTQTPKTANAKASTSSVWEKIETTSSDINEQKKLDLELDKQKEKVKTNLDGLSKNLELLKKDCSADKSCSAEIEKSKIITQ